MNTIHMCSRPCMRPMRRLYVQKNLNDAIHVFKTQKNLKMTHIFVQETPYDAILVSRRPWMTQSLCSGDPVLCSPCVQETLYDAIHPTRTEVTLTTSLLLAGAREHNTILSTPMT